MYENMTYENLMEAMLDHVENKVDKREGSIIYDALGPTAYSLEEVYFQLMNFIDLVLPDTSVETYLDRIVGAFGIDRKTATKAIRKVTAATEIEIGSRWQLRETSYVITGKRAELEYEAECEQYGSIGNMYSGTLEPINNSNSIEAVLGEVLKTGTDNETNESIRTRFYAKVRKPSTSGNKNDYYTWAMACKGVGAAKVFPLANGPGTVKVVITSEDKTAADNSLIRDVADHIEELRPVGADVSVVSAVEKAVNVSAKVRITAGTNLGAAQGAFQDSINEYLQNKAFDMDYISLARIGNLLLDIDGVEDYTDLKLNGTIGNVSLAEEEIAVTGAVRLEVM